MKAIYINLDPYLAAFAAWLKGGKSGTAPSFQPLPLAVTVPLGQDVAVLFPLVGDTEGEFETNAATIDGVTVRFAENMPPQNVIEYNVVAGLSSLAPSAKYAVALVSGSTASSDIAILDENEENEVRIPVTVFVRREQASGPVDLVDFTPPSAALTAAAINTALGGSGAAEGQPLKGVSLANATNAPAPSAAQINAALGGTFVDGKPLASVNIEGAMYGELNITTNEIDGTAVFSPSES